jgi:hypothetical protein
MKGYHYNVSILASSSVDRHGDRFLPEGLESAARQLNTSYLPALSDHDPRRPLPARTVGGATVRLPDGEVLLLAIQQVFEDQADLPPFDPDRSMPVQPMPDSGIEFGWDRSYRLPEDQKALGELAAVTGAELRFDGKKAVEPLSVLVLAAGLWVVGKLAEGFLAEMGADAWRRLKELLARRRASEVDFLFLLRTEVADGDRRVMIEAIFTRPRDEDLDWLRDHAPARFEQIAKWVLTLPPDIRKVVFEYDGAKERLRLLYAMRRDALPVWPTGEPADAEDGGGS